jgi:hypothetical protein
VSEQHAQSAPHSYRLLMAFAVVPFVDALIGFVGFPLVWYIGGHTGRLHDTAAAARGFAMVTGFAGLVVTVCGAVPVVLWLMKRGPVSLPQLLSAGVLLGNAPFFVYVIGLVLPATLAHLAGGTLSQHLSPVSDLIAGALRTLAIGSVLGASSAFVFWFLGIRRTDASVSVILR